MTLESFLRDQRLLEEKVKHLRDEIDQLKLNPQKDIYSLSELPFSKPTAYHYEKKGSLKITRMRGRSYVLKPDLLDCIKKEGK